MSNLDVIAVSVWAQFVLGLFGILVVFFVYIFVVALIKTVKEFRCPDSTGMNAGVSFGGELGIKHQKKAQNKK
jgi:hypothetical protein